VIAVNGKNGWKPSARPPSPDETRVTKTDYHRLQNRLVLYTPPARYFIWSILFTAAIHSLIFIPMLINVVTAICGHLNLPEMNKPAGTEDRFSQQNYINTACKRPPRFALSESPPA